MKKKKILNKLKESTKIHFHYFSHQKGRDKMTKIYLKNFLKMRKITASQITRPSSF